METTQSVYRGVPWWTKWAVAGGICSLLLIYRGYVSRGRRCRSTAGMVGKTVLITGGNCGIGKAAAMDLAGRGARVILACRDVEAGQKAARHIVSQSKNPDVRVRKLDLASLASVRAFCEAFKEEEAKINVLINNAGVFQVPFGLTEDGFETHMAVNHFGHFLLTQQLLELMKKAAPSRVVVVSSSLLKRARLDLGDVNMRQGEYVKSRGYANSKLANALFARELSRRLEGTGVSVYCVHPGMVMTKLSRYVLPAALRVVLQPIAMLLGLKTPVEGCQTVVYCACEESIQSETGCYYGNCQKDSWPEVCLDDGAAKKLWELSEDLTAS